jgi:hypothetical protein
MALHPDTLSMLFPIRVNVLAGSPVYIGTGPSEGTLWGCWEGHLWSVLDPQTAQSKWHNVARIIGPVTQNRYLESGRGYTRLGEVSYGGT